MTDPKSPPRRARRADVRHRLSHVDVRGRVAMVDVGAKPETDREAVAGAEIRVNRATLAAVRSGAVKKGDPLQTARLAGIMAAKRTADLIPLCHPLALSHIDVAIGPEAWGYRLTATVRTRGRTGVEMEALAAVSVAALTIYDMLKAMDRAMTITNVQVLEKQGGRSGHYRLKPASPRRRRP
jgi:cyclic pyranopterin phosphate synthase